MTTRTITNILMKQQKRMIIIQMIMMKLPSLQVHTGTDDPKKEGLGAANVNSANTSVALVRIVLR